MDYKFWFTVNNQLLKEPFSNIARTIRLALYRDKVNMIKKSLRVFIYKQESGYNGDDFIQDRTTIVYTGKAYRISRIIKNSLLKKIAA